MFKIRHDPCGTIFSSSDNGDWFSENHTQEYPSQEDDFWGEWVTLGVDIKTKEDFIKYKLIGKAHIELYTNKGVGIPGACFCTDPWPSIWHISNFSLFKD